jgi:hypothetical protein
MSAHIARVPGAKDGAVKVMPLGISPAALLVTGACGSPAPRVPSPLTSNHTKPAELGAKPSPLTVTTVPTVPEMGVNDKDVELPGTMKVAEASTNGEAVGILAITS